MWNTEWFWHILWNCFEEEDYTLVLSLRLVCSSAADSFSAWVRTCVLRCPPPRRCFVRVTCECGNEPHWAASFAWEHHPARFVQSCRRWACWTRAFARYMVECKRNRANPFASWHTPPYAEWIRRSTGRVSIGYVHRGVVYHHHHECPEWLVQVFFLKNAVWEEESLESIEMSSLYVLTELTKRLPARLVRDQPTVLWSRWIKRLVF